MRAYTILLADPHPVIRNGLRWAISTSCFSESKLKEASTSLEVIECLKNNKVDLLIADVNMNDVSGVDWLIEVTAIQPAIGLVAHSSLDHELLIRNLFRIGVKGFVTKYAESHRIIECLMAIVIGDIFVASQFESSVQKWLSTGHHKKQKAITLTKREFELVSFLAAGNTSSQIALKLNLSVRSIETYRSRLLQKLQINNTSELISLILTASFK